MRQYHGNKIKVIAITSTAQDTPTFRPDNEMSLQTWRPASSVQPSLLCMPCLCGRFRLPYYMRQRILNNQLRSLKIMIMKRRTWLLPTKGRFGDNCGLAVLGTPKTELCYPTGCSTSVSSKLSGPVLWTNDSRVNPRTDGGLGQLRTDGGGGGGYQHPLRFPELCVLARIKSVRKHLLSSTIFTKMIFRSGQYWGHQRSSKVKLWQYFIPFRKYARVSDTILGRRKGKKQSIDLELFFRQGSIRFDLTSTV